MGGFLLIFFGDTLSKMLYPKGCVEGKDEPEPVLTYNTPPHACLDTE